MKGDGFAFIHLYSIQTMQYEGFSTLHKRDIVFKTDLLFQKLCR